MYLALVGAGDAAVRTERVPMILIQFTLLCVPVIVSLLACLYVTVCTSGCVHLCFHVFVYKCNCLYLCVFVYLASPSVKQRHLIDCHPKLLKKKKNLTKTTKMPSASLSDVDLAACLCRKLKESLTP